MKLYIMYEIDGEIEVENFRDIYEGNAWLKLYKRCYPEIFFLGIFFAR